MRLYVNKNLMKVGWQKNHNSLVWEVSELDGRFDGDSSMKDDIVVINVDTENSKLFRWSYNDVAEDEIYGWNYVAEDGMKLVLIND